MINWINEIFNEDMMNGIERIPDGSIDLILTDPPYSLGKDYGNDSDMKQSKEYLEWTYQWIDAVIPKLKPNGSFYIFLSWQYTPEIFSYMKKKLTMVNEIIWDRRVPSMGGSTRKYSSVHDNLGFFVKGKDYFFDLDAIRIPYDEETKKARSRSIFVGKKWLELGYNPKDIWACARLHAEDPERTEHPTQKPIEIIKRTILASCPEGGIVLDPFMGSGTTAYVAKITNRNYVGFELNEDYFRIIQDRLSGNLEKVRRIKNKNSAEKVEELINPPALSLF
jgi:site-specific DNA-methyltransferase (adenine-specific)